MSDDTRIDHDARRANAVLLGLAFIYFLIEWLTGLFGEYGYFIDEFYYVACSDHLALGYVDHPPFSIFLLRLVRGVIGDSLPALRVVPSLAGALTVVVTGILARRLGAGLFGQALAATAAMVGSVYHVMFSYYSMNALGLLIWTVAFWILVEIERRDDPRLWLLFGAVAGLGLENKHTFALLLVGLGVGLVLTRARRHLASRWLWMGFAIAVLLILPNVAWQAMHEWPSIDFYHSADMYKNVPTPPIEVLKQQVLAMNPVAAVVLIAGLAFFLASRRARPFRHLGFIYVVLLLLMVLGQKSRPDRIAGAYTILFAGGGAFLGETFKCRRLHWFRWVLLALLVLSGLALAPIGLTVLSPEATARYTAALGFVPEIEKGESKRTPLPQWHAYRMGWELLADDVTAVAELIDPAERDRAIILAPTYGQAGAIELLGRGRGLPPVYAVQNTYYHWGPPPDPVDVAIVLGPFGEETVRWLFEEAEPARVFDCDWCMAWLDDKPIWLARKQKVLFRDAWPHLKHYE